MPKWFELAPPGYKLRLDIEKKKRKLIPPWLQEEPDFVAEEQAGLTALGGRQFQPEGIAAFRQGQGPPGVPKPTTQVLPGSNFQTLPFKGEKPPIATFPVIPRPRFTPTGIEEFRKGTAPTGEQEIPKMPTPEEASTPSPIAIGIAEFIKGNVKDIREKGFWRALEESVPQNAQEYIRFMAGPEEDPALLKAGRLFGAGIGELGTVGKPATAAGKVAGKGKTPRTLEKVESEFRTAYGEFQSIPLKQRSLDRGLALQKKYQRLATELEALKAQQVAAPQPGQPPLAQAGKEAKQPWEMKSWEYEEKYHPEINEARRSIGMGAKDVPSKVTNSIAEHKAKVVRALSEGKPVPPEVLADYPDLAAKAKPLAQAAPPVREGVDEAVESAIREAPAPEPVPPTKVAQGEAAITPSPVKPTGAAAPQPGAGAIPPVRSPTAKYPVEVARQDAQHGVTPPSANGVMPSSIPPNPPGGTPPSLPGPTVTGATVKERKFLLPEPPRNIAGFIPFAKSQAKGSYRGKTGGVEIIENSRQAILKARDMGEQTIGYVDGYIYSAGNVGKEFKLDAAGRVTNVVNPENRSLAWNDVMSNYSHYQLTPKQKEIALRFGDVYAEGRRLARSYGVEIGNLPSPDIFWQYIARRVKGKLNPVTLEYDIPQGAIGGFKMGAKISAQKQRILDQMIEGVDLGLLYENPQDTMKSYIKGIYRLIGNKQAENIVKPLTKTLTPGAHIPFGFSQIHEPALQGRVIATDLAKQIDKIFTPEQEYQALRVAADISGAGVSQIASLDISAPFIQGLTILGHDLKQGLKGKSSFIWAKSYGNMWKTVKNPESINKFREANMDLYKRAIESGVITGQSEFVSGVGTVQKVLGKIPKVGGSLTEGYRQAYGRMGQAYSDFLEIARIKMFEQLEPVWQRQGHDMFQLGAVINRMSGTVSSSARGVGANRRLAERIAAFAPNYLRSSLLIMDDLVSRGASAREVQGSMAALLGIGAGVYYAEETLRGEKPKMNPFPKRYGGDGAEAYTIRIGDTRVGFGSWMYGMIKTLAEVGAVAVDEPEALIKWNEKHPVVRFGKSKTGWGLSLASELSTGKNFYGQDFTGPQDYLMRIVESVTPISTQAILTQQPKGEIQQVGAELAGMRSYPVSVTEKQRDIAEAQGFVKPGEPLPPAVKSQVELSPEGRAIKEQAGRATPEDKIKWEDYDKRVKRDNEYRQARMSPTDWRDTFHNDNLVRMAQSELKERLGMIRKKDRKNMSDTEKVLDDYYTMMESLSDPHRTGRLLQGADQMIVLWEAKLTDKQRQDLKQNLHPRATDMEKEYYTDMDNLKPYFDVVNKSPLITDKGKTKAMNDINVLENRARQLQVAGDWQGAQMAAYEAQKLDAIYQITAWRKYLNVQKKMLRGQNPEIDRLLVKWGYVSKPLQPLPAPTPKRELAGVR